MADLLVDLLIGTTLIMALLLLLRRPVTRRVGPAFAYALWGLVALRLLLPPIVIPVELAPAISAVTGQAGGSVSATPQGLLDQLLPWLFPIWLVGAAMLFLLGLTSSLLFQYRLQRSSVLLAQSGTIRIFQSPHAENPVAVGLFDRRIYVPEDFEARWDNREAQFILAHEQVHHERGDMWINLIAFAILAMHWFNPIAWLAWKHFRLDQECSCDARVLASSDASGRQAYGRALLKASSPQPLPALTLSLITPKTIVERIEMMRNMDKAPSRAVMMGLGALALIAVPASATSFAHPHEEGEGTKEIERIVVFKSDGGETQTFTVKDGEPVAVEGTLVKIVGEDGAKWEGENHFVVMRKVDGDGEDMKVTVKMCDTKEECGIVEEKAED